MRFAVRPARPDDGETLREIERLAGSRFREVGLHSVADHEPLGADVLAGYATDGRSWVAVDEAGVVLGYALVDEVDGCAHVEQISVRPDAQGHGIGRALVDEVRAWAAAGSRPALTLTTFSNVPWNQPLYEHLGFLVLAEDEIGPELRQLRDDEAAHGLDPATRVCMRLLL